GQPHVRGVAGVPVCGHGDHVAVFEARLDPGDFGIGDVGHGQGRDADLDPGHFGNEGGVVAEIAVALPRRLHLLDVPSHRQAAEGAGDVRPEPAPLVVGEDLLKVVHAAEIAAGAAPVPVALQLDVVE